MRKDIEIWNEMTQMDIDCAEETAAQAPAHQPIPRTYQSLVEEFEYMQKNWKLFHLFHRSGDVDEWIKSVTREGGSYTLIDN